MISPQGGIRAMHKPCPRSVRGWAVWAATLAVVILFNGIVWIMVVTQ